MELFVYGHHSCVNKKKSFFPWHTWLFKNSRHNRTDGERVRASGWDSEHSFIWHGNEDGFTSANGWNGNGVLCSMCGASRERKKNECKILRKSPGGNRVRKSENFPT